MIAASIANHAAHLSSWVKAIESDPMAIFTAAKDTSWPSTCSAWRCSAEPREATKRGYPTITALLKDARSALAGPQEVSVETFVSSSMKAVKGYLKEWLAKKGVSVATLGDAVKEIKKKGDVDFAIAESLHQFYVYRNKQPNVGHGSVADSKMTPNDALLVLNMSASFINYFHRLGEPESA